MLSTHTRPLEIKTLSDSGEFEGYGSVFDVEDNGGDMVMKGAFNASIQSKSAASIKMLFQHDPSSIIGKWEDIREDDKGLYVKGKIIPAISKGAEVLAMMQAKVLDGLSIGFRTKKYEIDTETYFRKLLEIDLWEVSVVTFPMNTQARVNAVKNATPRDVEKILREAGLPNNYAKLVASHGTTKANELVGKQRDVAAQAGVEDILSMFK